jgi:hypothetical protein
MKKKTVKKSKGTPQANPNTRGMAKVAEHLEYVRFTGTPRAFREKDWGFNTDKEFANHFKVNPCTLVEWRKDPEFWNDVRDRLKDLLKDKIPDIMAGVYKKVIKDGSAAEAKFFMQYVDDWKEKSEVNVHYAAIKKLQESNERLFEEEKIKYREKNK